ncbi:MAG TPA: glutathionylspermidine synthase family protein [Candidatus Acidoferrum sp.]|nr:glutathionylspermidine synthase family protein [Candidatus Acidoferrum sp.]
MKAAVLQAGKALPRKDWLDLQRRAIFDFCKWDTQCEDHSVLAPFPLLLERATAEFLNETAEALCREALEAETEILRRPELVARLGLPGALRKLLEEGFRDHAPVRDVRVMRFDFHPTPDGWRISEVNADVPGGFVEASGWNALFAERWSGAEAPPAPSEAYARAVREKAGTNGFVAFVHATSYSDDRQVMYHLARCFSRHGLRTCLLSPTHLRWEDQRAEIRCAFASGCPDAIVRFFPAEWLPNLRDAECWKMFFQETSTILSNPGCAILLQTKRFPLVWSELCSNHSTWQMLLPETRHVAELNGNLDDSWVLKPALGRVGEGIGIQGITTEKELQTIARRAHHEPSDWVAQKRFEILPVLTETGPKYPCIGVFTINGKAAGFYGRIANTPIINQNAQDVAVLISSQEGSVAL